LPEALETIKLNLASIVARQLFKDLQKANGNAVKISPYEKIAYIDGKFWDFVYNENGTLKEMNKINDLEALAKLTEFAEKEVGNFVTMNKNLIEQLLESNKNLKSIEYYLTNKLTGNVVRNEYVELEDLLGKKLKFTSETEINTGEIKTTKTIKGNFPRELLQSITQQEKSILTPQEVANILSYDNKISRIFRPLIDEHPEVKELLEKLASEGKLTNDINQLEEIASKIKSFYEALDREVESIESKLKSGLSDKPQLNKLFYGVDLSKVVNKIADKIAEKQILNDPDAVLNGESGVPKISLSDVLKHFSMSNKAKIVLNYLETDSKVYNEVIEKLNNFSPVARDYILAEVFDHQFVVAITDAIKENKDISITPEGLENVVQDIDDVIETIKIEGPQGSQVPVSTSSTSTTSSGTASTSSTEGAVSSTASNASSNGTATVLQPPAQQSVQQGAQTPISQIATLKNALPVTFPEFNELPSGAKFLFMAYCRKTVRRKGRTITGRPAEGVRGRKREVPSTVSGNTGQPEEDGKRRGSRKRRPAMKKKPY